MQGAVQLLDTAEELATDNKLEYQINILRETRREFETEVAKWKDLLKSEDNIAERLELSNLKNTLTRLFKYGRNLSPVNQSLQIQRDFISD